MVALVEPSVDIQIEESDNEEQEINNIRRTKKEIEFDYEEYIKKLVHLNVLLIGNGISAKKAIQNLFKFCEV